MEQKSKKFHSHPKVSSCPEISSQCLNFFVGGIPSDSQHSDLFGYFKHFGIIKSIIIFNNKALMQKTKNKKLLGFCFLKYERLYRQEFSDKSYVFRFAGRVLEIEPLLSKNSLRKVVSNKHSKRVFLQNVPQGITKEDLVPHFELIGPVTKCYVVDRASTRNGKLTKKNGHKPSNYGCVVFANKSDAQKALTDGSITVNNSKIYLKKFSPSVAQPQSEDLDHLLEGSNSAPLPREQRSPDSLKGSTLTPHFLFKPTDSRYHKETSSLGLPAKAAQSQSSPSLKLQNLRFNIARENLTHRKNYGQRSVPSLRPDTPELERKL